MSLSVSQKYSMNNYEVNYSGPMSYVSNYFWCILPEIWCWAQPVSDS